MGFAAGFVALLAAAYLSAGSVIETSIKGALVKQGAVSPSVSVRSVGLTGLVIESIKAGGGANPDLSIDRIHVRYSLGELITKRRVRAIEVGPGRVTATLAKDGTMSVAGLIFKRQGKPAPLPFDALHIVDLRLGMKTPEGAASGALSGSFSQADGGWFKVTVMAPRAGAVGVIFSNASVEADLALARDGRLSVRAGAKGDAASPFGAAKSVALTFSGSGSSWRDALAGRTHALAGGGKIDVKSAEIPSSSTPALAGVQGFAPFRSLLVHGAVAIVVAGDRVEIAATDKPALLAMSDAGDELVISGAGGDPLYRQDANGARINLSARISGAASGDARIDASRPDSGAWSFESAGALGRQELGSVALQEASFAAKGTVTDDLKSVRTQLDLAMALRRASFGRFTVDDAPVAATVLIEADLGAKTLVMEAPDASCITLRRGRVSVADETTEAGLTNARLCADGGPYLTARWGVAPRADIKGRLAASNATFKIAAAIGDGAPPDIRFTATLDPVQNTTTVAGTMRGGRVALNDTIRLLAADGAFSGTLDARGLSGVARLASVTVQHRADPEQFSPARVQGALTLERGRADFRFNAMTPGGKPLGAGAGLHDIGAGRGALQFATGRLEFSPQGLQVAALLPGLRGVVGGASGAVSADLRAAWAPGTDGFSSSGEFRIDDLSFRGPGVAVSQTTGIAGNVRLSSLAPLKTEGAQSITIRAIDIGALQLEGGSLELSLPGDETLRLIKGEFPWFGGKIGAYGANSSLSGDRIEVNLRAESVDLKQMLDFLKIPGLSGEGVVEGVLPLVVEDGKSFIRDGEMIATTPGVVRYAGAVTDAAAENNKGAKLAFDLLRELRFAKLGAKIDGPLDGDLKFTIIFEGSNDVMVNNQPVRSPVIYRITLEAPLLALLEQAQVSTSARLQLERSGVLPEKKVKE